MMPSYFSVGGASGSRRIPCYDRSDGVALLLLAATAPPISRERRVEDVLAASSCRDRGAATASTSTRPRISTPRGDGRGPTTKPEPTSPTRRRSPSPLRSRGRPQTEGYRGKGRGIRKEGTAGRRRKTGVMDDTKDCLGQVGGEAASSGNTHDDPPAQETHGDSQDGNRPAAMDLNHDGPDAASAANGTRATSPIRLLFSSFRRKNGKMVWSQIRNACDRCTEKKIRCDRTNAERGFLACSACKKAGQACAFGICLRSGRRDAEGRKRTSPGSVIDSMSARLVYRRDVHPECQEATAVPATAVEPLTSSMKGKRKRESETPSETEETPSAPSPAKRGRQ